MKSLSSIFSSVWPITDLMFSTMSRTRVSGICAMAVNFMVSQCQSWDEMLRRYILQYTVIEMYRVHTTDQYWHCMLVNMYTRSQLPWNKTVFNNSRNQSRLYQSGVYVLILSHCGICDSLIYSSAFIILI